MSGNNYDFIMSPPTPPKRGPMGFLRDPFIAKIVYIVGGAIALMIVMAIVVSVFFGGRNNTDEIISLAQKEQEIIRLSNLGKDAAGQSVKNAAANTLLSLKTQQKEWLGFLSSRGQTIKDERLNLAQNSSTDQILENAEQNGTFDSTYAGIMRDHLEAYANSIREIYQKTSSEAEQQLLSQHYDNTALLLKQWP